MYAISSQASDRPYVPALLISRDSIKLEAMAAQWSIAAMTNRSHKDQLRKHKEAKANGDLARNSVGAG